MFKVNLKDGLITLAGLAMAAHANAADLTCGDIVFSPEAYAAYEFVDKACLQIVERDGGTYAKMTAKVVAQTGGGTYVRYRHANGELGPSQKAHLPEDFQTMLAGQPVSFKDLAVRQDINIYIAAKYWTAPAAEAEAVTEEVAPVVESPLPPPPAPAPEPEPEPEVLPTTAGPLSWLLLSGLLFLMVGGALRRSRRRG